MEMHTTPSSILVTGAAGALGRIVFNALKAEGHHVLGFDQSPCPWDREEDWLVGSLTSMEDCMVAMKGRSVLVHLAAVPDDAPFERALMPSNLLGLHHVLEAARHQGVQRVLLASSGQVVWEPITKGPWPVPARHAPGPLSWYALTKVFAEQAGAVYARDYHMDVMAIRLGACPRHPQHAKDIGADLMVRDVYLSPGDLSAFFRLAVTQDWAGYHCLNAASRPIQQERLSLVEARSLLGFEPQDQWPMNCEQYWGVPKSDLP